MSERRCGGTASFLCWLKEILSSYKSSERFLNFQEQSFEKAADIVIAGSSLLLSPTDKNCCSSKSAPKYCCNAERRSFLFLQELVVRLSDP